ncbi:MAG: sigma-70 family RNA polymerase sigma factor [Phycisphaerales bacterium]|nr:sigma-70 family RNA polymerase sigma factor [Phycisphaerales bacterium]
MPGQDPRTDAELVAALNAGEPSAFEALYLRHRDWVFRVARRYAPPGEDPADITHEVFLTLLRKFPGFRLTARLTTYLFPIARHTALARARARQVEARLTPLTGRAGAVSGPGMDGPSPELAAAVDTLPPGQREVLLMRAVDEMTLEEIALALAIPLGTVKSRLHLALQTLRSDARARRYFENFG